ncbi:MAG: 50S ribosomal protein L20 [Planctomycetota bacterium]
MRVSNVPARHKRKKQVMKSVKGFYGGRKKMYRRALENTKRAERQAYIGRKLKKREFRQLWITRINIATRELGLSYSRFMAGLAKADIRLDRKQLSEMAIHQPAAFAQVVEQAKAALG